MRYIKTYEKIKIENDVYSTLTQKTYPKVGDYIVPKFTPFKFVFGLGGSAVYGGDIPTAINISKHRDSIVNILEQSIGRVEEIRKGTGIKIWHVKFNEPKLQLYLFCPDGEYIIPIGSINIKYWSSNKKKLELFLTAKKYNL